MSAFRYRAFDLQGTPSTGVIEADSGRAARSALRERGLHPVEVIDLGQQARAAAGRPGWLARVQARRRLPVNELALLSRQWATLLAAGLTVEHSLSALIEQAESERVHDTLAAIRSDVVSGHSLRIALDRHSGAFPTIYRAAIAAGEQSGELAAVMNQLADHLERGADLQRKTMQALIYPALVAVVALLVVTGLMVFVVPQVVGVFAQSKQALPLLTRLMIGVSNFIRDWGWLALAAGAAALLGALALLRDERIRHAFDRRLLALPVLGRHLRSLDATRFASTLAILVGSGVPLLAALDAAGRVVQRLPIRTAVREAAEQVREGRPLARALAAGRAFPPMLIHMVANGEATGRIDELLDRAARLQQQELETRTATLTSLLEPLLLLVMGAVVLLIVLAVMQPIIEINTLMR